MARLRRAVLLGAGIGAAGAGEGRRGGLRVGVERRGAAAAVRRALRLARVAVPRLPPRPRRAVSSAAAAARPLSRALPSLRFASASGFDSAERVTKLDLSRRPVVGRSYYHGLCLRL